MDITQRRVIRVLQVMQRMVEEDPDYAEMFAIMLGDGLDDIHSMDGFGTEGQNDPRGDFRANEWSMDFVSGVDD